MDLFGIKALRKQNNDLAERVKALQATNIRSQLSSMTNLIFPTWGVFREVQAYQLFDDVYSVVSRLATSTAQICLEAYDEATDEELPNTDNMVKFLKTMTLEKREELFTYLYLCGEVFMYKERVTLGPDKGKLTTHFLHPTFVSLIISQEFPQRVVGIRYQDTQFNFSLPIEEVIYIKYFNPSTIYMDRWRGISPIKALAQRLTRLQANMSLSVAQLQNGGVPSIVYDKTPGLDADRGTGGSAIVEETSVMGQHKDNFARFLRNPENKGAPYFAAGEMGVIQLGLSPVDMDALASADVDFDKICNAYSISSVLFNNKKASTESNVKEMRKDMYTNAIIPNLKRVCDGLTAGTVDVFGEGKCIKPDLDDIPELQVDLKDKAAAFASLPVFRPNDVLKGMDLEPDTSPEADKLYIKAGYTTFDEMNTIDPIDPTGDYGQDQEDN